MDNEKAIVNKSPWSERSSLPNASPLTFLVCMLLSAACGALIPVADLVTMFLWILLGASFLSVNILLNRTPLALISLPLSYVAGVMLSGSYAYATLSLLYVIPAIVISACLFSRASCSATIVALTATQSAMTVGVYALALYTSYGSVSKGLNEIYSMFDSYITSLMEYAQSISTGSGLEELFSPSMAAELLKAAIVILPGMLVCITVVFSAITVKLTWKYLKLAHAREAFRPEGWPITVSVAACVLYLVSYFGACAFNLFVASEIPQYACTNLAMILTPAMFLCGIRALKHKLSRTSATAKTVAVIVCVISAIMMPSLLSLIMMIITFMGAIFVIKYSHKADPNQKN